jgi:hypothetical protein
VDEVFTLLALLLAEVAAVLAQRDHAVVEEVIPDVLADEAEAARRWFAREQCADFKLTGIVDPQDVLGNESKGGARELQLILCGQQEGQDVCLRERFEIKPDGDGFDVTHLSNESADSGDLLVVASCAATRIKGSSTAFAKREARSSP